MKEETKLRLDNLMLQHQQKVEEANKYPEQAEQERDTFLNEFNCIKEEVIRPS